MLINSPLEQFDVINFFIFQFGYDYTFFNILIPLLLINIFIFIIYILFKYNLKVIPEIWQYFFEKFYFFLFNIIKQQLGYKGFSYFPFIFFISSFIFLNNVISLFPFGIALTSHIILIFFLSFSFCISIFLIGLLNYNLKFLQIFIPHCPFILLPISIPIEIFSYIIRMFSLAIRLAANILAGHTLVYIISTSIIYIIINISLFFYFILVLPLFAVLLSEIVVAFLQAYVFIILLTIYLNDSINFNSISH